MNQLSEILGEKGHQVLEIEADASVFEAVKQMVEANVGSLLVTEGGKITGMLKDVAYQFRTPEFWGSMELIAGPRAYHLGGAFGDAKGQPGQSNAISHGCVPARFKQVNIINTGRRA